MSGLAEPTALVFLGTDDFLVLEKSVGKVRRVTGGALNGTAVLDLDVEGCEERGLLGIALHPDFASNHFVYLFYNPSNEIADDRRPRRILTTTTTSSTASPGTGARRWARARSPST